MPIESCYITQITITCLLSTSLDVKVIVAGLLSLVERQSVAALRVFKEFLAETLKLE